MANRQYKALINKIDGNLSSGVEMLLGLQAEQSFKELTAFTEGFFELEKELVAQSPGFWTNENKARINEVLDSINSAIELYSQHNLSEMTEILVSKLWPAYTRFKHQLGIYDPVYQELAMESGTEVRVLGQSDANNFTMVIINGQESVFKKWDANIDNQHEVMLWSMLLSSQPLFKKMPLVKIYFRLLKPGHVTSNDKSDIETIFQILCKIIFETNEYMKKYKYMIAIPFDKALFYCFENNARIQSIYKECQKLYPDQVLLKEIPSGWDLMKRDWVENPNFGTVDEFVKYIETRKIKRVITLNYFIYDSFLNQHYVFLPPILNMLGVESLGIDYDPIEMITAGPFKRAAINQWEANRFSFATSLFESWDRMYQNPRIFYTPVIQHYSETSPQINLDDDYNIIILSNSRLDDVKQNFPFILFLLQEMDEKPPFTEHELWYYAMCKLVQNTLKDEFAIISCMNFLLNITYQLANFIKYEVIHCLETDRQVQIYGDKNWGMLFPEYYQNCYLSQTEIKTLYTEKNHLFLLLNNCFSYVEAGGPVYDAIKNNIPFINYPALLKTGYFEGFRYVEYTNRQDLNRMVNNAPPIYQEPELRQALIHYNALMREGEKEFIKSVFHDGFEPKNGGVIRQQWLEHDQLLQPLIDDYIQKKKDFLQRCFEIIVLKHSFDYSPERCKPYADRSYIKRGNLLVKN